MEPKKRTDEELEKLRKAGRIAAEARRIGADMIRPGVSYYVVAKAVEDHIIAAGARPAFPVNIAVNEIAAHYSPYYKDKKTFQAGDVVKLDLGAHIDGYLSDTAITVEVGSSRMKKLSDASRLALETVMEIIGPKVSIEKIGGAIEDTIHNMGYVPIENLTGHSIEKYTLHAGLTIPNVREPVSGKLWEGDVVAIEPFATEQEGLFRRIKYARVVDGREGNIYTIRRHNIPAKSKEAAELLDFLKENWKMLPFCHRWIHEAVLGGDFKHLTEKNMDRALNELIRRKIVYMYSVLKESRGKLVSQWEHTFIITEDGAEVTTL